MKNIRNILWGLVLVVLGLIIALNTLGITDIDLLFDGFWTLFIIIPCFIDLFKKGSKLADLIGIFIGVTLLLMCQGYDYLDVVLELTFPAILIIIGLSFIFKNTFNKKIKEMQKVIVNSEEICATFSGHKLDYKDQVFKGCKMSAIFGGIDCDLENAIFEGDAVIDLTTIFGGIDIRVPKDINIVVSNTSIFGGVDNKTSNNKDNEKTLYINATCLFGGVDIK